MVIDHAGGLHHGIADGGTGKGETAGAQVAAHRFGFLGPRGEFAVFPEAVTDRPATDRPDTILQRNLAPG